MSKILVSGCSYTDDYWTRLHGFPVWPDLFDADVTNLGKSGLGNDYILNSIVDRIAIEKFDYVIAMWTEFLRIDLEFDDDEYNYEQLPWVAVNGNGHHPPDLPTDFSGTLIYRKPFNYELFVKKYDSGVDRIIHSSKSNLIVRGSTNHTVSSTYNAAWTGSGTVYVGGHSSGTGSAIFNASRFSSSIIFFDISSELPASNKSPVLLSIIVSFDPPKLLAKIGFCIDWASTEIRPKASGSIDGDTTKSEIL